LARFRQFVGLATYLQEILRGKYIYLPKLCEKFIEYLLEIARNYIVVTEITNNYARFVKIGSLNQILGATQQENQDIKKKKS